MKQIFKIFKKYLLALILIIGLLFAQAMCDLALPDYTSKIVNVGIQQNGIELPLYEAVTETKFNNILTLVNQESKDKLLANYELVTTDTTNEELKEEYPILNTENIYVLKSIDEATMEELANIITKPMVILANMSNISESDRANLEAMLSVLPTLSLEEQEQVINEINSKLDVYETSILEQMAVNEVINEYNTIGLDISKIQNNYILITGLKMLGISFLIMVITAVTILISSKLAANFGKDLREKVFAKVMDYSNQEMEEMETSSLITRTTNDIQQVQNFIVMATRMIFYAPIIGIGAFLKVSGNSMGWIIGLAIGLILLVIIVLFSIVLPKFQTIQKRIDKLNLVARETLTGLPVIRAFGTEKHEIERFDDANTRLTNNYLFVNRVMTVMMPLMTFIMNGVSLLIIWVGASQVDLGNIQVGTLIAFITYTMQIIMAFLMISILSIIIPRSFISIKRIAEILNKKPTIIETANPKEAIAAKKGEVEFKNVSFRYPDADADVIENISFKTLKGKTTAFIGSTGSGKSTLINLIPRFYDATEGEILVDGVNVRDLSLKDLRSKIGYVPQKGILFSGDIKSNILFGNVNLTDEELKEVARVSQSLDFIEEKEGGFASPIAQGGTNVSGGQRQRLSIARAIALNPEIYIFDDSFSALDYQTDLKLRQALNEYTKDATILIVAQRISTILKADQIIVLDKGKIVGKGTHEELLKSCAIYKEIALSQLKEEELK